MAKDDLTKKMTELFVEHLVLIPHRAAIIARCDSLLFDIDLYIRLILDPNLTFYQRGDHG